jgi:hypothetical protein
MSSDNHLSPSSSAGTSDENSSQEHIQRRRRHQHAETKEEEMPMFLQILTNTLPMLFISLLMTAGVMYYTRLRAPTQLPPPVGISFAVTVDSDIMTVYNYLSQPEHRTEWHDAVEVSGPAIDHSAIVGRLLSSVYHVCSCAADAFMNLRVYFV